MLLVVFPGGSGRKPVLTRIQKFSQICVLVSESDRETCAWAKEMVEPDCWIEVAAATDGQQVEVGDRVTEWMARTGMRIDGVLCYDEFGVEIAAMLCERLSLPGTPLSTVLAARSKYSFRKRCEQHGIMSVGQELISNQSELEAFVEQKECPLRFPCVLKPTKGAGSWHVRRVDRRSELTQIWQQLHTDLAQSRFPADVREAGFVLEEYIGGCEIDVDGWAVDGKLQFMLVSDNRPAIEPGFIEIGGIYPSQLPQACIAELQRLTLQTLQAFPRIHGCFHFEAKIDPETSVAVPIELNIRVGGAECPASVAAVTGFYLPEVAARLALGQSPMQDDAVCRHTCVATTNIHLDTSGTVAECSDAKVDHVATKLVTSVVFSDL
eukprot:CAMPEP_0198219106 /NCGR_PEP_ID=MMETSP1445-20131203/72564_1 /TAXON_ID=36898 /ORGANISM="Pyramimonas sp., Strain CCMP2087" /LENGTH=379 /DNA_ID=CAMNT_0043896405 /DNA_START=158 /DNA_END=1294 /DNA_ORIENTATION=-